MNNMESIFDEMEFYYTDYYQWEAEAKDTIKKNLKRMHEIAMMIDNHDCHLSPMDSCDCQEWVEEYTIISRQRDLLMNQLYEAKQEEALR